MQYPIPFSCNTKLLSQRCLIVELIVDRLCHTVRNVHLAISHFSLPLIIRPLPLVSEPFAYKGPTMVQQFAVQNPVQMQFKLEESLHQSFPNQLPTLAFPTRFFSNVFYKLQRWANKLCYLGPEKHKPN